MCYPPGQMKCWGAIAGINEAIRDTAAYGKLRASYQGRGDPKAGLAEGADEVDTALAVTLMIREMVEEDKDEDDGARKVALAAMCVDGYAASRSLWVDTEHPGDTKVALFYREPSGSNPGASKLTVATYMKAKEGETNSSEEAAL